MLKYKAFRRVAVTLAALALAACDSGTATPPAAPPPSVSATSMEAKPVALQFEYAGRVAAFREVEVRARVAGILQAKSFVEGSLVREGDVLFHIDPAPFEATLAHARAQLQETKAELARATREAERAATLYQRQFGSEKARDEALAARELAAARVAGAEAQMRTAEINLGYTTVTAPLSGVTSLRLLPEGSLVGTGSADSLLTRITQLDPVYVHFSFTDTVAAEIRRLLESGMGPADGKLIAKIRFGDGEDYDHVGHLDFTDSSADLQTGTVRARAVVPNPDRRLRPGQFVRVTVQGITRPDTIVVPQAAVMQGPQGQFVYALDGENKASIRPVTVGREVADGWIAEKGLKSGDRVVTEGVIKVRPGAPVTVASGATAATKAAQR